MDTKGSLIALQGFWAKMALLRGILSRLGIFKMFTVIHMGLYTLFSKNLGDEILKSWYNTNSKVNPLRRKGSQRFLIGILVGIAGILATEYQNTPSFVSP